MRWLQENQVYFSSYFRVGIWWLFLRHIFRQAFSSMSPPIVAAALDRWGGFANFQLILFCLSDHFLKDGDLFPGAIGERGGITGANVIAATLSRRPIDRPSFFRGRGEETPLSTLDLPQICAPNRMRGREREKNKVKKRSRERIFPPLPHPARLAATLMKIYENTCFPPLLPLLFSPFVSYLPLGKKTAAEEEEEEAYLGNICTDCSSSLVHAGIPSLPFFRPCTSSSSSSSSEKCFSSLLLLAPPGTCPSSPSPFHSLQCFHCIKTSGREGNKAEEATNRPRADIAIDVQHQIIKMYFLSIKQRHNF